MRKRDAHVARVVGIGVCVLAVPAILVIGLVHGPGWGLGAMFGSVLWFLKFVADA